MDIGHYCRNGRDQVDNLFTKDRFLGIFIILLLYVGYLLK